MYIIEREQELTPSMLGEIINKFNTVERPKLQKL